MRFFALMMFAIAVVLSNCPAVKGGVMLVEGGKPSAVIVLPRSDDQWWPAKEAADMLVQYIQRISDARIEIEREDRLGNVYVEGDYIRMGMPGEEILGFEHVPGEEPVEPEEPLNFVLVGQSELAMQLGISAEGLGPGGIRLKTKGNSVVLLGGPERLPDEPGSDEGGLRYAAIELLEHLGCRYLWPGESGMVIPRRSTVVVEPLDLSYTPVIRSRRIRWHGLHARHLSGMEQLGLNREDWRKGREKAMGNEPDVSWLAWHRLGGTMPNFGHAGAGLRNAEKHLMENPEWFALQGDGTRNQGGIDRWRLCKSNPELIEHVAQDIIQRRNEDPGIELVSLCPNDGGYSSWCMCENCKKLDPPHGPKVNLLIYERAGSSRRSSIEYVSLTDRHVYYWNSIAERVTRVHPDLLFGVSAYGRFSHPPVREKLHPNFVVRYVPEHTDYFDGWIKAGLRRVFWRPNILLVNRRHGELRSIVGQLCDAMNYFAEAGIIQTDFDSITNNWATLALSYYAAARLTWNPYLRPGEIIEDFARAGFGGGADYIIEYFNRVEDLTRGWTETRAHPRGERCYTPEAIAELRNLLNSAEKTAADTLISERIAFLRMGLNFTELQETLEELSWHASEGREVDREYARKLIDLNTLVLRDIVLNHNLVVNSGHTVGMSATFSQYASIGGRTVVPSDSAFLDRVGHPDYGLTGREDSLEEMLAAFGL